MSFECISVWPCLVMFAVCLRLCVCGLCSAWVEALCRNASIRATAQLRCWCFKGGCKDRIRVIEGMCSLDFKNLRRFFMPLNITECFQSLLLCLHSLADARGVCFLWVCVWQRLGCRGGVDGSGRWSQTRSEVTCPLHNVMDCYKPVVDNSLQFFLCVFCRFTLLWFLQGLHRKKHEETYYMIALWFDQGCDQETPTWCWILDFCLEIDQTHLDVHLAHVACGWRCEMMWIIQYPAPLVRVISRRSRVALWHFSMHRTIARWHQWHPMACIMVESKLQNREPKYELLYLVYYFLIILDLCYKSKCVCICL